MKHRRTKLDVMSFIKTLWMYSVKQSGCMMNWNEYKVRKCPSWIPSIKVKSVFCSTFLFFSCPLPPFFPTNSLFLIPHVRCAAITALIAVNWDFFGKQSSLNDLTKFIQVPPRHSLVFDNISPLLIYVGRSHCFHWLGIRPVPEELWTGVTSNFCLFCLSCFSHEGS